MALVFAFIGLAVAGLVLRDSRSKEGGPIVVLTVIVALSLGQLTGSLTMRRLRRSKLRFFRTHRHD